MEELAECLTDIAPQVPMQLLVQVVLEVQQILLGVLEAQVPMETYMQPVVAVEGLTPEETPRR